MTLNDPRSEIVVGHHPIWIFDTLEDFVAWLMILHPPELWGPREEALPECWQQHSRIVQLASWAWAALESAAVDDSRLDEDDQPIGGSALATWWLSIGEPIAHQLLAPREPCNHQPDLG